MDLRDPVTDPDRVTRLRHDVMNPLTVILGYAQLLTIRSDMPAEACVHARRIFDETRRCIEIFEDDKARHESYDNGAFPFERYQVRTSASGRSISILVVDDDPGIRLLAREVLESGLTESGSYSEVLVCEASGRAQAMERANAILFDALLMDLNIDRPGGGINLLGEIERATPGIAGRAVFMSGGVLDAETQNNIDRLGIRLLKKPFNIDELVDVVQKITGV